MPKNLSVGEARAIVQNVAIAKMGGSIKNLFSEAARHQGQYLSQAKLDRTVHRFLSGGAPPSFVQAHVIVPVAGMQRR